MYPDGTTHTGYFVKGLRHGRGRVVYANGDVYEGHFENDIICGTGRFVSSDGMRYEGSHLASPLLDAILLSSDIICSPLLLPLLLCSPTRAYPLLSLLSSHLKRSPCHLSITHFIVFLRRVEGFQVPRPGQVDAPERH